MNRVITMLLLLCLTAGCTGKEQQAQYDRDKETCVGKMEAFFPTGKEKYDIADPDPETSNLKADFLDATDALIVAKAAKADRYFNCSNMKSRLNLTRRYVHVKTPAEYRAEAEAANAAFDATQQAGSAEYEKQAVRHIRSIPGAGNRYDTYVMKDGTTHTCRTSVTDAGRAVDCD